MSIQDLATTLGGRLCFGPMPPLDGHRSAVDKIRPLTHPAVGPRDVILATMDAPTDDCGNVFLEGAFACGAGGVIAERAVAPWPGRFCLVVEDTQQALRRLVSRLRCHDSRPHVVVIDPRRDSPIVNGIRQAWQCEPAAENTHSRAGVGNPFDDLLWGYLEQPEDARGIVEHVGELPWSHDWFDLLRPDVVVWVDTAAERESDDFASWIQSRSREATYDCQFIRHSVSEPLKCEDNAAAKNWETDQRVVKEIVRMLATTAN